jgi:acetoin utilization protein AcuB
MAWTAIHLKSMEPESMTTPTIESVMTPYPYSIEIDAHVGSAKSVLAQFGIHHLPVTDGGQLVGVVTEWGLKQAAERGVNISVGSATLVRDVLSREILTVAPDVSLPDILVRMADQHAEATLVVRDTSLLGIFTMTDVCRHYARLLLSPEAAAQPPVG